MNTDFKIYLTFLNRLGKFIGLTFCLLIVVTTIEINSLRSVGELLGPEDIHKRSLKGPIQWISGYMNLEEYIKTPLANRLQPQVIILGSSRVLQIRSEMFSRLQPNNFYNLGRASKGPFQACQVLRRLTDAGTKPKLVLLGLDWWHFMAPTISPGYHPTFRLDRIIGHTAGNYLRSTSTDFAIAWSYWAERLILLQNAWKDPRLFAALNRPTHDPTTGRQLLGVSALQAGFRNDGSFRYSKTLASPLTASQMQTEGLQRIKQAKFKQPYLNQTSLYWLKQILIISQDQDINLIAFLPPIMPAVHNKYLQTPQANIFFSTFSQTLKPLFNRHGVSFFDFTDPAVLDLNNTQFVDWFHPGEAADATALLYMARSPEAGITLLPYIDTEALTTTLQAPANRPLALFPR